MLRRQGNWKDVSNKLNEMYWIHHFLLVLEINGNLYLSPLFPTAAQHIFPKLYHESNHPLKLTTFLFKPSVVTRTDHKHQVTSLSKHIHQQSMTNPWKIHFCQQTITWRSEKLTQVARSFEWNNLTSRLVDSYSLLLSCIGNGNKRYLIQQ